MNILKKKELNSGDGLDKASLKILRAASANEEAAREVADSPFLFTRLKAKINAEREQNLAKESWLAWVGVVWQAAPAMVLLVVLSFVLFWTTGSLTPSPADINDRAGATEPDAEQLLFGEREQVSSDDFLATILNRDQK